MSESPQEPEDSSAIEEVTPEVAAEMLGEDLVIVREWLVLGTLSSREENGRQLIRVDEIEAWAAERARRREGMRIINEIGAEQLFREERGHWS